MMRVYWLGPAGGGGGLDDTSRLGTENACVAPFCMEGLGLPAPTLGAIGATGGLTGTSTGVGTGAVQFGSLRAGGVWPDALLSLIGKGSIAGEY
jgi:hypothetical protein